MNKTTYPLTLTQRLKQGDAFRQDALTLQQALSDAKDPTGREVSHTGDPSTCPHCVKQRQAIVDAYREYFLSKLPDRWHSKEASYHADMQAMFAQSPPDLKAIRTRANTELRRHLQRDLCQSETQDGERLRQLKEELSKGLESTQPTADVLQTYRSEMLRCLPNDATRAFVEALESTNTHNDRIPLYLQYYELLPGTMSVPSNQAVSPTTPPVSPAVRNLKAKYLRMFEQGEEYEHVHNTMQQDAMEARREKITALKRLLDDLKFAKGGVLREAQKKMDRRKEREREKERARQSREESSIKCSKLDCARDITALATSDGVPTCALCDWLAEKSESNSNARHRTHYCTPEHGEADFVSLHASLDGHILRSSNTSAY